METVDKALLLGPALRRMVGKYVSEGGWSGGHRGRFPELCWNTECEVDEDNQVIGTEWNPGSLVTL